MHPSANFPYILIGASAGGVYALLELAAALRPEFPAPILVVQHIGTYRSQLPQLLSNRGPNRAVEAEDGQRPEPGTIHVAPPDHHMLVEHGRIRLTRGPKEHHARPAIDPLFRSAGLDLGARAIGVILTGMLDDGSAGLRFIKECGGIAVVQEPADALEQSMPRAAIAATRVDHVVPLAAMAALLLRLAGHDVVRAPAAPPPALRDEHVISFGDVDMEVLKTIAHPSTFSCPDCGGVLFELDDTATVRFRCHTGHAFSLRTLLATQGEMSDVTLWAAVRGLREKEALLRRIAEVEGGRDRLLAADCLREADALLVAVDAFRKVMKQAPGDTGVD